MIECEATNWTDVRRKIQGVSLEIETAEDVAAVAEAELAKLGPKLDEFKRQRAPEGLEEAHRSLVAWMEAEVVALEDLASGNVDSYYDSHQMAIGAAEDAAIEAMERSPATLIEPSC